VNPGKATHGLGVAATSGTACASVNIVTSPADPRIEVPDALVSWHRKFFGETGRAWIDALPGLAAALLDRWQLRLDGASTCGAVALVLPVLRADGMPAVLKLQPVDEGQGVGEPDALRTWNGAGAVRLLDHDPASGSMLLERLDADRPLATVRDDLAALQILSELLARLSAVSAPAGVRHLSDVAADLLDRVPRALALVRDPSHRPLVQACACALEDVLPEAGDRLVHCDLHYFNILAPHPPDPREPWLAIDPEPLAGDPGFALLAALHNRWEEAVATGDVPRAIRRRFDLMTDVLGLDRRRATAWTLARILYYALRDIEGDYTMWHTEPDRAIARILLDSAG
jgi:streptomycin 6-kinase